MRYPCCYRVCAKAELALGPGGGGFWKSDFLSKNSSLANPACLTLSSVRFQLTFNQLRLPYTNVEQNHL